MDNHDDYVDGERSMRQHTGQMQNPYGMMSGGMGMPGNFYGQGGMGGMGGIGGMPGGMPGGQMGGPGGMGWQPGRQDQGQGFRAQPGAPGGRPGANAQVHHHLTRT